MPTRRSLIVLSPIVIILSLLAAACTHSKKYGLVESLYPPSGGNIPQFRLPQAGTDEINIRMVETYEIHGVGKDTVTLEGVLTTRRGHPLLGDDTNSQSWQTSSVIAEFTALDLKGTSQVFGPVHVTLDTSQPAFAVVRAGKCASATGVNISMPQIGMTFRTSQPVQLRSTVTRVPPIGDERTVSVNSVELIDETGRVQGKLHSAQVMWRGLIRQAAFSGEPQGEIPPE